MADNRKKSAWKKIALLAKELISNQDSAAIWALCEQILLGKDTKLRGQYFTPSHVARLALSGIKGEPKSFLDPMAGHGIFLRECRDKYPNATVVGVELDPLPAMAMSLILDRSYEIINADVFKWAHRAVNSNPSFSFSALIGNPAYVSYQNLRDLGELSDAHDTSANAGEDYGKYLIEVLKGIAEAKGVVRDLDPVINNWSGLSDFATYTLLLAWLLTSDDGQIAFVMSNHWMERDYGRTLRSFLAQHGTVRGIVSHRLGNWFPQAEIPTSIFVYSKGTTMDRQDSLGIPFIEIEAQYTDDIESFLTSELKGDFWSWVDSLSKGGQFGPIHVSFKRWPSQNGSTGKLANETDPFDLHLPGWFRNDRFVHLERIGWSVHQGLRTGCNELFYVKEGGSNQDNNAYVASMTKNGRVIDKKIQIPKSLLLPAVRKVSGMDTLVIEKSMVDDYFLNLDGKILAIDKELLKDRYPPKWLATWKIDEMEVIPRNLAMHLQEWATTPYEGKGKVRCPVIELSAVKTNIYMPPSVTKSSKETPNAPRFWYQIRLQRRHFGEIFIPRVSAGPVRTYLVKDVGALVIDANFSTFISGITSVSPRCLWIWLNSNAFRLFCELNGAVLGGGALKVEAATLSKMPIAKSIIEMKDTEFAHLDQLLTKLSLSNEDSLLTVGYKIDEILFGDVIAKQNIDMLQSLINKRRKK